MRSLSTKNEAPGFLVLHSRQQKITITRSKKRQFNNMTNF